VEAGDLGIACEVLVHALRTGEPEPGILRRVIVAALARGNRGLAQAMVNRLSVSAALVSDWPADAGATYGAVIAGLQPQLTTSPPMRPLEVPAREIARILPRSPRESFQLRPVVHADGFTAPPDEPLYAVAGAELLAIDVHAKGPKKPILFALPVQFLEHVVLCGNTLIVPDLEHLVAVDYRTGQLRWELPGARGRLLDGLGVQSGVLHISAQSDDPNGGAEFLGIEPTSGRVLFTRSLPSDQMKPVPKPTAGQLLVMQGDESGGANLLRLDPVTGATVATVQVAADVLRSQAELRPDGLATRVYPQGLCADLERVYLPIDSTFSGDAPRLLAIGDRGTVAWSWQGLANSRLSMAALRGDRIVIVEGSEDRPGRVSLLQATTGEVLRSSPLGVDIDVLNWQRTWLPNPAPAALMLSDSASPGSHERRLICFGIDDGMPSFLETLGNEDGEIERQPQFGPGFVAFGVRPAQRGMFRLHVRKLSDRTGALPDGQKYQRLVVGATFGMATVGPYTVVSSTDCLLVLGSDEGNK